MAALSGSFKGSQTKVTYALINLLFLSHLALSHAKPEIKVEVNLLDRHQRDVALLPVASGVIPENVNSTVTIYDLTSIAANRSYLVINDSAGDPSLFQVSNSKLTIASNLTPEKRKLFDYEKFKSMDVVIRATNQTNNTDVLVVTVRIQLSDVNDEAPVFTSKPAPFLATLPVRPAPATVVFTVTIEDADSNPDLSLSIDQVTLGGQTSVTDRFMVSELVGGSINKKMYNIITSGSVDFQQGAEYTIMMTARDKNNVVQPSMTSDKILVLIGNRVPQFYEQSYKGRMYENTVQNSWVMEENSSDKLFIQAKQFQTGNVLTYSVSQNIYFDLRAEGEVQRIVNKRSINYEDMQSVSLTVTVTEAVTSLTSSVQVLIAILDENDNNPTFSAPQYSASVREDLAINSTVLTVTANDADSGVNGEIVFSVQNTTYFDIRTSNVGKTYLGAIIVKRELDYDRPLSSNGPFFVVATDKGVPIALSTSVQVSITLQNVNDNPPTIVNSNSTVYLNETSAIGSIVTVVLASDIDGDAVKFYFEGKVEYTEIFRIRENNGQILLNSNIPPEKDQYFLKVIAVDDDSCCLVKTQNRTSTATFTVNIVGINMNKPAFTNCLNYDSTASVKEKSPIGTFVIQVSATDPDRGENGVVYYQIRTPDPNTPAGVFQIDKLSGNITVKAPIIRGPSGFVQVTVGGRNPPDYPLLEGRCSFRVNIIDINDNPPVFQEKVFTVQVSTSTIAFTTIFQVAATDADFGSNANITYSFGMIDSVTNSTFSINTYTGVIILRRNLDMSVPSYNLIVIANDNGKDPGPLTGTANVSVLVVTSDSRKPPEWIPEQTTAISYNVSEEKERDFVVATLTCKSNTGQADVEFRVFDTGSSIITDSKNFMKTSFVKDGLAKMNLVLRSSLDYEAQKQYKLSIVCQSLDAAVLRAPLLTVTVNVIDANNEIPQFVGLDELDGRYKGSVAENSPPGVTVLQISATDADNTPGFNNVSFTLLGPNKDLFAIANYENNRADVVTTNLLKLDRENTSYYLIEVEASDKAPAFPPNVTDPTQPNKATRFIDVRVTDVNDNPPSFNQSRYNYTVKENSPINSLVAIVKAYDPDEIDQGLGLDYRFTDGNVNNAFSVFFGTGAIQVAKILDYEAGPKSYSLTLMALDQNQLHTATTVVQIDVTNENDHYPVFTQNPYEVRNLVTEGNTSITPDKPLLLVTVKATDADVDRPETDIRYYLYNDPSQTAVNQLFTVNAVTGQVYLIGPLDRDVPPYFTIVTVEAHDELINPLINYTDVKIYPIDINDNYPEFNQQFLQGSVNEHAVNTYVMTVIATDKDEGDNGKVAYRAAQTQPNATLSAMFVVRGNGEIYTANDVPFLDRELLQQISLVVEAYDNGTTSLSRTATATITILDINDQSPYFDLPFYRATVSENQHSAEVVSIPANDLDSDPKNRQLVFKLDGNPGETKFFQVQSVGTIAVISLAQSIDYETDPRVMNFTLEVTDNAPGHVNTTKLQIVVLDYNDNAPEFVVREKSIVLIEEELPGKKIANFTATDKDEGINAEIEYSIVRASDPRFEFYIDPISGVVETRKSLDREVAESMTILILATDHGEIPLTGTATLYVTLTDINDNAPRFLENYHPIVPENKDNSNFVVQVIYAYDPDTRQYGPPFGFGLPTPCNEPACKFFNLALNPSGDGGNGTATVTTSTRFDREETKYYYLPIVMWDMDKKAGSMTATNTLTITIGDENDNPMLPGHQDILIYNYEGHFTNTEIGRVYANDPDDWDLPDKTFTYVSPDNLKQYFSINPQTGMITLNPGLAPNNGNAPYQFNVNVNDKKFNTVTCTVSVTIQLITDESVRKSGGVRLGRITAEEFIKPTTSVPPTSKYQQFRQAVAGMLGYPGPDNVEIVSLTDGDDFLDVRFSSHGSPYVNPSQGESAIMLNLPKFEQDMGLKVIQVPINLCMDETSDVGCYNYFNVTGKPELVNANGTSYVMIRTSLEPEDGCVDGVFPDPVECQGDYCFNGGTCIKDDWGKLSCACLTGFDGPRCQQRRHSFDGKSAAFYQGLSACSSGRTSIDFITTQPNGLIMYSGPIVTIDPNKVPGDYLILELKEGYPNLRLNLGRAEILLQMTGRSSSNTVVMSKLNDGQWHHVDIDRDDQKVTMTVDHCKSAVSTNGTTVDWSPCRISGTVPGGDILLNVQSLLQLGGRYPNSNVPAYPAGVTTTGFNGCLKNLVHNTKLYDLYYKVLPAWNSGLNGCPQEEAICGETTAQPVCGQNGTCESRWQPDSYVCSCKPGWYGDKCAKEAPAKDLQQNSYFRWTLNQALIDATKRAGTFQLMYRTRQKSGTLFVFTTAKLEAIVLHLVNSTMTLTYDMGQGMTHLQLKNAVANSGQWTTVRVERYGNEFLLIMDGGEGRNYNYQQTNTKVGIFFEVQPPQVTVGATLNSGSQVTDDLQSTCIRDVRFNDKWLPLTTDLNNDPDAGGRLINSQGVQDGCYREDCPASVVCTAGSSCYPLWEAHDCRCGSGLALEDSRCVASCNPNPCLNFGTCSIASGVAVCACPVGWSGQYCGTQRQVNPDNGGLGGGAIAGIVIAIIVLLILLILLLIFLFTRKRSEKEKILEVDPDDDFIRENVVFYDEEGAGEEDHAAYDITLLQRPMKETFSRPMYSPPLESDMKRQNAPNLDHADFPPRSDRPDVGTFIKDRMNEAEKDDPLNDSTRAYNFEGDESDAGSLSSLNTSSSGGSQDYDYLSSWGPKFAKLADMYGAGQSMDDV